MTKKYHITSFIAVFLFAFGMYITSANAQLRIDITRGNVEPMPIAIPNFFGQGQQQEYGQQISAVLTNNLTRTKLFRAIDPEAFIQNTTSISIRPRFADWRLIGTQVMVQGVVSDAGNGKIKVEMRLWDVLSERQMLGKLYSTDAENWRRIAHIISDEIYKRLTGEDGYFDSRIVYIAESGAKDKRVKRLAIMDQDGANHKYLTDGSNLVLTPRFSPTRQEITYLSYFENRPRVYLFNLQTGQRTLVGAFKGMTFAPRFTPDGNGLVMSHAENGNSDIYFMDLRTRKPRRLTNNPAIDTSPSMSPDGQFIAFNSDRGGSAQIYIMRADGSNVKRISFGRGSFTTPVWSPRGDLIAFTWQRAGKFHIGVMRPDGKGKRILTESFLDEAPTWSPNGRILMFFRQSPGERGKTRIYSIDLTGNQNTLLEAITPGDASDPAWSPLN